ncbi:glutathione hydrolase 1 proenzyme-like isoform X3 [Asterias amurensis]|uniref:glutathione hydrolase 1 proenzyme-like isoform X1 n=1 Tax=Asterias amurensis TaxID=7602 RepID=UPI003AB8FBDD
MDITSKEKRRFVLIIILGVSVCVLVCVGVTVGLYFGLSKEESNDSPSVELPYGVYQHAAVATDNAQCSQMARDILLDGGSAVDAAITAALCLGVTNPQSSGLGGGLFMVIYKRNEKNVTAMIANEIAPAASYFDMFVNDTDEAKYGVRSVSVPGELAGLWAAHQKYGILSWERLLRPIIYIAENGFPLTWHTVYTLQILEKNFDKYPALRELYTKPDGSLMKVGDIIRAPVGLINTLREIAAKGASVFYQGDVGQKLVQDIQSGGGIITMEDLTNYVISWEQPSVLNLAQYKIMSTSIPSSGDLQQFTVSILQKCNLGTVDFNTFEGKLKLYHYFIEASTFAIGFRLHIGEADTQEVHRTLAALSSSDYAQQICSLINATHVTFTSISDYDTYDDLPSSKRAVRHQYPEAPSGEPETPNEDPEAPNEDPEAPNEDPEEPTEDPDAMLGDTSHLSVLAENGDAVSLTTTVGKYFGGRFFSNQTGLFLNDHMANFYYNGRTPPWEANKLEPGRRSMSTVCPTVITEEDGSVKEIVGTSGGLRIISTTAWVMFRSLWSQHENDLDVVIEEPRLYPYSTSHKIYYENDFPQDLLDGLRSMGHNMVSTTSFSVSQAIIRDDDLIHAHSDSRKKGDTAGY